MFQAQGTRLAPAKSRLDPQVLDTSIQHAQFRSFVGQAIELSWASLTSLGVELL